MLQLAGGGSGCPCSACSACCASCPSFLRVTFGAGFGFGLPLGPLLPLPLAPAASKRRCAALETVPTWGADGPAVPARIATGRHTRAANAARAACTRRFGGCRFILGYPICGVRHSISGADQGRITRFPWRRQAACLIFSPPPLWRPNLMQEWQRLTGMTKKVTQAQQRESIAPG